MSEAGAGYSSDSLSKRILNSSTRESTSGPSLPNISFSGGSSRMSLVLQNRKWRPRSLQTLSSSAYWNNRARGSKIALANNFANRLVGVLNSLMSPVFFPSAETHFDTASSTFGGFQKGLSAKDRVW